MCNLLFFYSISGEVRNLLPVLSSWGIDFSPLQHRGLLLFYFIWTTNYDLYIFFKIVCSRNNKPVYVWCNKGEKMIYNKKVQHFKGQKYSRLKKQHTNGKRLFNDPVFPAINATIGDFNNLPEDIEWKRPGVSSCILCANFCSHLFSHAVYVQGAWNVA